ncbi:MAG: FG-GAP-like repeat-containing protein [Nocardioides sp.]
MRSGQSRFVTACQQMLAIGVVLAVLVPAASVSSLTVVATGASVGPSVATQRPEGGSDQARVETAPVAAIVDEFVLTPALQPDPGSDAGRSRPLAATRSLTTTTGGEVLTSRARRVRGFGAVGVTWSPRAVRTEDQLALELRTRDGGRWSPWSELPYHAEHGPDPGSVEATSARPGTEPVLVGDVGKVQIRAISRGRPVPADLKLAVIAPGTSVGTARQAPAADPAIDPAIERTATAARAASLSSRRAVTTRPAIYSRAQWGADERRRDSSSLRYYEVHAGFVHHTVNANDYSAGQVPGILRAIYAYHTQSRGWSDIGYNFLIDRFGRIWEGRYGGIDRPVVGAHTKGYNDDAFAAAAIGNFEIARPSSAMVAAYGRLFAWKLALHGVDPVDSSQRVGPDTFRAINGHRDAGTTACPGKYLYAELPAIRAAANAARGSWAGRRIRRDLVGSAYPDLIVRKASDRRAYIIPTGGPRGDGTIKLGRPIATGLDFARVNRVLQAGDWDRDGHGDLITRSATTGRLRLHRGDGTGRFATATVIGDGFESVTMLAAVGDMTGDGYPDLVGQPSGRGMRLYPGLGRLGLDSDYSAYPAISARRAMGAGRWDADGAPDLLVRVGNALRWYAGNGPGGLTGFRTLPIDLSRFDFVGSTGNLRGRSHAMLVVRSRATGRLWAYPANATRFGRPLFLGDGFDAYDMIN